MIVCTACHAENPDGTKICVKCGTELPKAAVAPGKAKAAADTTQKFGAREMGRDLVDVLWLFLILLLICVGFWGEATHWTWHLTEREEPKIIQEPVVAMVPKAPRHVHHLAGPKTETSGVNVAPAPEENPTAAAQPPSPMTEQPAVVVPPPTGEQPAAAVPPSPPMPEQPPVVSAAQPPAPAAEQPVVVASTQPVGEKPAAEYGNPDTFYARGKAQYDNHHYQRSFNYLKQALEIDPTFAKAYFALGYLYARFDMDDASVRMYKMALRFDPTHADATNNLGMMYYHAGNYDDAADYFQKATALNDQNADYQYNLGSVYLDKGQLEDALAALQKATALRPTDGIILNNMAVAYEKLGKKQEALDAWQKVLQNSKDPELLKNAQNHINYLQTQG